jgi:hypothetical protein
MSNFPAESDLTDLEGLWDYMLNGNCTNDQVVRLEILMAMALLM